jgi:hypothetical protein
VRVEERRRRRRRRRPIGRLEGGGDDSVRGSGGATKNGGAGEKKKKDVSLSRDASDSLAGHLFLSATLSERQEEARASFASPAAALVFGSREDAADGVAAIGGEGDELYDLD